MKTVRVVPSLALAGLCLASAPGVGAQSTVEEALAGVDPVNAARYVEPLTRSLARGLWLGLPRGRGFEGAFSFRLGIRGVVVGSTPEDRTASAALPDRGEIVHPFHPGPDWETEGSPTTPTALGQGPGATFRPAPGSGFEAWLMERGRDPDDVRLRLPRGLDLDPVSLLVVDGSLGLGQTTRLDFRLTPTAERVPEVGETTVLGVHLSHELGHYLWGGATPVDVVLGTGIQRMRAGGWMETVATSWDLSAGVAWGPLRLWGAGSLGRAGVDVGYRAHNPEAYPGLPPHGEIARFSADVPTRARASAGATLSLGILDLAGDYGFGDGGAYSVAGSLRLR